jgi:hypothetical protein
MKMMPGNIASMKLYASDDALFTNESLDISWKKKVPTV